MNKTDILLVEDNLTDAEMTLRSLKECKVANHIKHVEDGQEALDFIYCKGKYSDNNLSSLKLILLDLNMPKISGLEVLKTLKSDPDKKDIPVVILTSSAEEKDIVESYKFNANSYIVKPVDFEQFSKSIQELGFYWLILNRNKPE